MTDLFSQDPVRIVSVQLPVAMNEAYSYGVPDGISVEPGDFVLVPLGPQQKIGVVWDENPGQDGQDEKPTIKKLKNIISKFDLPPLPKASRQFVRWVAKYNLMQVGMVLRMVMSAPKIFEPEVSRFGVKLAGAEPGRMTEARAKVCALLKGGEVWSKSDLAEMAGVSTGVIDGLVKAGTLISVEIPKAYMALPDPDHIQPSFSEAQDQAVHLLRAAVQAEDYSVTLLDGVTGSGKTEVYFEAVAEALRQRRQVLILLPEIALTSQFIERFEKRFGVRPVEWHSTLAAGARGKIWKAIATGEARAVIAARSGLFLPFKDLGLIVVDEEHDAAFKQEDRVSYQGRDMAVVRASIGKIPLILASATPSIESHVNARHGRYRYVQLTERFSGQNLPNVRAIDLKKDPPEKGRWLSPVLIRAMLETLERREQSLLFLNRRGYAPLTLCRACGYRFDCPQCTAWLVDHRGRNRLQCHHCGFSTPIPKKCPKCGEEHSLVPCGPGVERVAEEVKERFPEANVALLSSDLIPSIIELRAVLETIEKGDVDIVIGTQIVAKGHNFPNLTLVGVVDGDLGLGQGGDPRAGERTLQLLQQVTGRAGRFSAHGRGLIQTYLPDHPVMEAIISGQRDIFLEREIQNRHSAGLPPFGRLASIMVTSKVRDLAFEFSRMLALKAPQASTIQILGPAEAPIAVIRGRFRYRLLLKAQKEADLQGYLRLWLDGMYKPQGDIRVNVDIDPYNFL